MSLKMEMNPSSLPRSIGDGLHLHHGYELASLATMIGDVELAAIPRL